MKADSTGPGRILVTDGEFKHTLAIVRSLGLRGYEVHVTARDGRAPAVHSRYARAWHRVRGGSPAEYGAELAALCRRLAADAFLPVGSSAVDAVAAARHGFPDRTPFALAPEESLAAAYDKNRTAELARGLGVAVPRTAVVHDGKELQAFCAETGFPVVLKGRREAGVKQLRYLSGPDDAEPARQQLVRESGEAPLAQEYVRGYGIGCSLLYWHGECVASFTHRRIREWPPTGGTSSCAEVLSDPPAEAAAKRLLDALRWHGVAMVEFRGGPATETPKLIEINGKFWGSLELAILAGVDFPGLLAERLTEGGGRFESRVVHATRVSWPLGGDLYHALARPLRWPSVLGDAWRTWRARRRWVRDPAPFRYQLVQWGRSLPTAWHELRTLR